MGRIKELINKFIQPNETETTFNELALASGLSEEEIKELNKTINGIDWGKFARENNSKKKTEKTTINEIENNSSQIKNNNVKENKDLER